MRRLLPGLALLLAYTVTPGAGEITENVAHYLIDGHAAHAAHEDGEESEGDEHGCSGPFQTCPCHGTSAFLADGPPIEVGEAEVESQTLPWFVAGEPRDAIVSSVFRPPIV